MYIHLIVLESFLGGQLEECVEMVDAGMHASIRKEPDQMQSSTVLPRVPDGIEQNLVPEEFAILDRLLDTRDRLLRHPTRPQGHVPDLGVTARTLGQSDSPPGY